MKKTFETLDSQNQMYHFHDYKKVGVQAETLRDWLSHIPLEQLLNKKGTTWRKFSAEQQATAHNLEGAIALMVENPSAIKRPVIVETDNDGKLIKITAGIIPYTSKIGY